MRINRIAVVVLALLFVAGMVDAKSEGKGSKGKGKGAGGTEKTAVEKVGDETANAVADALTGTSSITTTEAAKGVPPGLAKKGKMPPGLEKKGKTPEGWSKGEKTGWDKTETSTTKNDSVIRGWVNKVFGKKEPAEKK